MKSILRTVFIFAFVISLTACSEHETEPDKSLVVSTRAYDIIVIGEDVYVVGDYGGYDKNGDLYRKACYWKNGSLIDLDTNGSSYSRSVSIVESAGDIFILGTYDRDNDQMACYWRNDIRIDIGEIEKGSLSSITSFTVLGEDVYMIFNKYDYGSPGKKSWKAHLWKNGFITNLHPFGSSHSCALSIILSDGDIYVTGDVHSEEYQWVACIWKNDQIIFLEHPNENRSSSASAIVIVEDDIYIAGSIDYIYDDRGRRVQSKACYWKNGLWINLNPNISNSFSVVSDIVVKDNDVYITGSYSDGNFSKACYWKNGMLELLNAGSYQDGFNSTAEAIFVAGDDIYIAGYYFRDDYSYFHSDYIYKACYWKNDRKIDL